MKNMWDDRYGAEAYAYGKHPNVFFRENLDKMTTVGRALFPAEGEGRNAIYAAQKGWQTFAFDTSIEGRKKALALGRELGVQLEYETGTFPALDLMRHRFDLVVLIFAHMPSVALHAFHKHCVELLNPGGTIILEGFSVNNLPLRLANPSVGGPDKTDLLFTKDLIESSFMGMKTEFLEETSTLLDEGLYHQGEARVIRYIGKKLVVR